MDVEKFRQRLELLRGMNVRVLPLDEALQRLHDGTLPHRSAAITLDDAFYDAYKYCRPLLNEYRFPSTVYVTTYYVEYNRPVFDIACRYLLWKANGRQLSWPEIFAGSIFLDESGRASCSSAIYNFASRNELGGREKDDLLAELARRLDIDYEQLCRDRVLHLVNTEEIKLWAREADLELHTHCHRVSRKQDTLCNDLGKNISKLEGMIGGTRRHLAYPGGACLPEFSPWLNQFGLKSATTCQNGIASAARDPMLLPRVMETSRSTELELESWITGVNAFLPVRKIDGTGPDMQDFFV